MRRIALEPKTVVGLAVGATVVVVVLAAAWTAASFCVYNDYGIFVTRLPDGQTPERFVNLSAADLESHPIITRVLAAYADPSLHPGSRFEDEIFIYPIDLPPSNHTVVDANEFLVSRWGGRPYPVVFTTGEGTYWTWSLSVNDPGPIGRCR
jgi:hypothetical protein